MTTALIIKAAWGPRDPWPARQRRVTVGVVEHYPAALLSCGCGRGRAASTEGEAAATARRDAGGRGPQRVDPLLRRVGNPRGSFWAGPLARSLHLDPFFTFYRVAPRRCSGGQRCTLLPPMFFFVFFFGSRELPTQSRSRHGHGGRSGRGAPSICPAVHGGMCQLGTPRGRASIGCSEGQGLRSGGMVPDSRRYPPHLLGVYNWFTKFFLRAI